MSTLPARIVIPNVTYRKLNLHELVFRYTNVE